MAAGPGAAFTETREVTVMFTDLERCRLIVDAPCGEGRVWALGATLGYDFKDAALYRWTAQLASGSICTLRGMPQSVRWDRLLTSWSESTRREGRQYDLTLSRSGVDGPMLGPFRRGARSATLGSDQQFVAPGQDSFDQIFVAHGETVTKVDQGGALRFQLNHPSRRVSRGRGFPDLAAALLD
jgi:hypothetical protein